MVPRNPCNSLTIRTPSGLHVEVWSTDEFDWPIGTLGVHNGDAVFIFVTVNVQYPVATRIWCRCCDPTIFRGNRSLKPFLDHYRIQSAIFTAKEHRVICNAKGSTTISDGPLSTHFRIQNSCRLTILLANQRSPIRALLFPNQLISGPKNVCKLNILRHHTWRKRAIPQTIWFLLFRHNISLNYCL